MKTLAKRVLIALGISPCCYRGIYTWSSKKHVCKKCGKELEKTF